MASVVPGEKERFGNGRRDKSANGQGVGKWFDVNGNRIGKDEMERKDV
jgi:hypothetical protein